MSARAPLFVEIAKGPDHGRAHWITTSDGVRIRAADWPAEGDPKGTVLLFPGRTEYIEKYGPTAAELAERGYATLAVDWRGQGLSDRLAANPMVGHIAKFKDHQKDVQALVQLAQELKLPKPWHLLAHSMGGCIGLRALYEDLPVATSVFSGPMWGIHMSPTLRPFAWALSWAATRLGRGEALAPSTSPENYVIAEPFETNKLTCDQEMYQLMIDQLRAQPELGLGGPSLNWLLAALRETRHLARRPSPDLPCLTLMGSDEEIVDVERIKTRMQHWPRARFELQPGLRHEVLMEDQATQTRLFDLITAFWAEHAPMSDGADLAI